MNRWANLLEEAVYFKSGVPVWLAARLYGEFRNMDKASPLAIEGLKLELMAVSSRQRAQPVERKPPRRLAQTVEILHAFFPQDLSLMSLAEAVGVHRVHLARTFLKHHNCTPGEYAHKL